MSRNPPRSRGAITVSYNAANHRPMTLRLLRQQHTQPTEVYHHSLSDRAGLVAVDIAGERPLDRCPRSLDPVVRYRVYPLSQEARSLILCVFRLKSNIKLCTLP